VFDTSLYAATFNLSLGSDLSPRMGAYVDMQYDHGSTSFGLMTQLGQLGATFEFIHGP
jgi:hypothetical protein